jgi:hypothetical protein
VDSEILKFYVELIKLNIEIVKSIKALNHFWSYNLRVGFALYFHKMSLFPENILRNSNKHDHSKAT